VIKFLDTLLYIISALSSQVCATEYNFKSSANSLLVQLDGKISVTSLTYAKNNSGPMQTAALHDAADKTFLARALGTNQVVAY